MRTEEDSHPKKTIREGGPADQIVGEIEALFPNWRAYRDLVDCIECELHALRQMAREVKP